MVLQPTPGDVNQVFTISVSVSPLFNQTQFTLVVTEASTEHPTVLLGGIPLEFYALKVSGAAAGSVLAVSCKMCFVTYYQVDLHVPGGFSARTCVLIWLLFPACAT